MQLYNLSSIILLLFLLSDHLKIVSKNLIKGHRLSRFAKYELYMNRDLNKSDNISFVLSPFIAKTQYLHSLHTCNGLALEDKMVSRATLRP